MSERWKRRRPKYLRPPSTSLEILYKRPRSEAGGAWIWGLLLLIIAGGGAGGLYFRDMKALESGGTALAAADQSMNSGDYEQAAEGYRSALSAFTGVSDFTPLAKETVGSAERASVGLRAAEAAALIKKKPLKGYQDLKQAAALPDAPPALGELMKKGEGELLLQLAANLEKGGYRGMEALWPKIQEGCRDPAISSRAAVLVEAGLARSKARAAATRLLKLGASGDVDGAMDSLKETRRALDSAKEAFEGSAFAAEFPALNSKLKRFEVVRAPWAALRVGFEELGRAVKIVPTNRLGDLERRIKDLKIPAVPKGADPELEKRFSERVAKLSAQVKAVRSVAHDFAGMSLVIREGGSRHRRLVFIARKEFTRGEYKRFIAAGIYQKQDQKLWTKDGLREIELRHLEGPEGWKTDVRKPDNLPVIGVSFYEAQACARWLGGRLPLRKEWLAGYGSTNFPWGDEWQSDAASLETNDATATKLSPVGSYPKGRSKLGLDDLIGNVSEWIVQGGAAHLIGGSYRHRVRDVKNHQKSGQARYLETGPRLKYSQDPDAGFRIVKDLQWDEVEGKRLAP